MSRYVKELMTQALRERYASAESACVVELTGMNVQATERLRRQLRQVGARVHVVKNSMARRALAEGPLAALGEALEGPCALVTAEGSIIEVAKTLIAAAKEFEKLRLKGAVVEGDPTVLQVEDVARMRSRTETIGEVLMLILSPGRAVAGCIGGAQARLAGCLKAMADKKEEGEAAAAA
ncbi:MAG TPA: 50S ribosomal protein L10 [Phycisphaerae bacterium]|nr:50S ribosomal protein L10 [Phycisphaerae bacterium]HNU44444.1 50S ribosomal protein L10 [Phycisphaerae bacterium]